MERALLVLSQKFGILLQMQSGYYEFKQGKNSVNVLFFFWSHKKAFFLLAIPCNSSIFALAEEKCGVLKLFLTTKKLVILFKPKSKNLNKDVSRRPYRVGRASVFIGSVGIPVPFVG